MVRHMLAAAAAVAMLAGCATTGGDGQMAAGAPADMTPSTRDAYVQMAAASDLYEIQSSQLALTKAQRPEVRSFAQMLVTDHTNTTQQLMAAATASGAGAVTPTLLPMQARMIAQLEAAPAGRAFDRVYTRQQVRAHTMALALHRNYADNGDAPALRTVAATAVPVITGHLEQARRFNR